MTWTAVRVSGETKARLETLRETLLRGEQQTRAGRLDPDSRDRVGLDQVIQVLLARYDRDQERKRRSAARRRGSVHHDPRPVVQEESGMVPAGTGPQATPADGS